MDRKLKLKDVESILASRSLEDTFKKLEDMPHPDNMYNLTKASKRIAKAIKSSEKIVLVGDYDVDGVVSSVIVKEFFDEVGYPLEVYIPNRFSDGYGVSEGIVKRLDCDLIITVDNGIGAFRAGEEAKRKGIDLIITDHHTPSDKIPLAYAVVNPKLDECNFEFKEICGATVAWYLVAGIKKELQIDIDLKRFFDILSIAIVADVMPLIEINRVILKKGLEYINSSKRVSIDTIREFLNISEFRADTIAFQIAPRINSAGRMDSAMLSFDFLYSKDRDESRELFSTLDSLNTQRKDIERELSKIASYEVRDTDSIAVIYGEDWHEGIIGIVASRIAEEFKRPAIVLSINGSIAKGSARSYGEIDILSYIDREKELLIGYGGHKKAAGLSLKTENLELFRDSINSFSTEILNEEYIDPSTLGVLDMGYIDFDMINLLDRFEPYGEGNPRPKFIAKDMIIKDYREIGKNKEHRKLILFDEESKTSHDALAFRCERSFDSSKPISFEFTLNKNEFNNRVSIQLLIENFLD